MSEKKASVKEKVWSYLRDFFSCLFWGYILIQLFFVNLDPLIFENNSHFFILIGKHKILLFLFITSVFWLILGNKKFGKIFLYITFFPLVILFWKIPTVMFKNWTKLIIFTPVLFEVFSKIKRYFIFTTIFLISCACILNLENLIALIISMIVLASFLINHLYSSFNTAYKANVFSKIHPLMGKLKQRLSTSNLIDRIVFSPTKKKNVNDKFKEVKEEILTLYSFFWIANFINEKANVFLKSRKIDIYLIFTWCWTVFVTLIIYSYEFLALYKISPDNFNIQFKPTYFTFFEFSFSTIVPPGLSLVRPISLTSKLICYSEVICSIVIVIILFFTILTAAREKYREDIIYLVEDMEEIVIGFQSKFSSLFNLALTEAEHILLSEKYPLVNALRKLRGLPELKYVESEESKSILLQKALKYREEPDKANSTDEAIPCKTENSL